MTAFDDPKGAILSHAPGLYVAEVCGRNRPPVPLGRAPQCLTILIMRCRSTSNAARPSCGSKFKQS